MTRRTLPPTGDATHREHVSPCCEDCGQTRVRRRNYSEQLPSSRSNEGKHPTGTPPHNDLCLVGIQPELLTQVGLHQFLSRKEAAQSHAAQTRSSLTVSFEVSPPDTESSFAHRVTTASAWHLRELQPCPSPPAKGPSPPALITKSTLQAQRRFHQRAPSPIEPLAPPKGLGAPHHSPERRLGGSNLQRSNCGSLGLDDLERRPQEVGGPVNLIGEPKPTGE